MKKSERGFTLLELLVVIAIVSIMTAIIYPAFASARRDARRGVSTSNLKQCGMALLMYCDDYNGPEDMPSGDVAANLVLKKMPTCDPNDTWRSSCSENFGRPLIGSYGYVNNLEKDDWRFWWLLSKNWNPNPSLLASIFYANPVPVAFHGLERDPISLECLQGRCRAPNRVLRFRLDGSVKLEKMSLPPGISYFRWREVISFDEDMKFGLQP